MRCHSKNFKNQILEIYIDIFHLKCLHKELYHPKYLHYFLQSNSNDYIDSIDISAVFDTLINIFIFRH